MTDTRRMASTQFRTAFARLEEAVDVTVLGRVIGHWYPAGAPGGWPILNPASRSGPVIPSEDPAVGTRETDQAPIGAPETGGHGPSAGNPSGARVTAHGTGDERAPSGGGSQAPAPLNVVEPDFDRYFSGAPFEGVIVGEVPKREVIVDPHFNAKGSRPAPKSGGRT